MMRVRMRKGVQAILLGGYTVLLLTVTLLVQGGRGVRTNLAPFEDIQRLVARASRGDVLSNGFLYGVVGIVGNLMMFAIWGFLAWKFLDSGGRSAARNHLDVVLSGALLSLGIETIQFFLPTRAADVNDVFWNVLGTMVGSAWAHLDRSISVDWD